MNGERGFFKSTVVRMMLVLLAVCVLLVVIGVAYFLSYRSSRNQPLKVNTYPGAQQVSRQTVYQGFDQTQYVSNDPVDQIERFYADQDMDCKRQYEIIGQQQGQDPVKRYSYTRCLKDRSGLNITQYTQVTIQPNQDAAGNPTGQVVINVERHWGG